MTTSILLELSVDSGRLQEDRVYPKGRRIEGIEQAEEDVDKRNKATCQFTRCVGLSFASGAAKSTSKIDNGATYLAG